MAEGRSLGDPETIHFGLVPRAHRGIVAINELPDLAERIQVALLNVMEERDIQVRGYTLRLPLDVLLVASANPEDYTNRGRIITPLKDRFGAEVRTHYPLELADEIALVGQEAELVADGAAAPAGGARPVHPARCASPARSTRAPGCPPGSPWPPPRPLPPRRCAGRAITGEDRPVARPIDLESVPAVLRGKLEFASGEEGRETEHLSTCCAGPPPTPRGTGCAGIDLDAAGRGGRRDPGAHRRAGAGRGGGGRAARAADVLHRDRHAARRGRHRGPRPDGRRRRAGPGAAVPHPPAGQGPSPTTATTVSYG